ARESTAAKIAVRPTLIVDPMLHVLRQFHCLVSFVRNSSSGHAFSGSARSGLPKSSFVPSGRVRLASGLPVFSACSIIFLMLGRRGLPGLRAASAGVRRPSGGGDGGAPR